jgi:ParB family transcriptional regulator, chromosome partitioning protein
MASRRSMPGVQRTDAYLLDPHDVALIEDEDHPLYDARVLLPVDENLVRNIMVNGVIKPIVVQTGTDPPVVIDGRQRVKAAREANRRLQKEGKELIRVAAVRRRGEEGDLYGVLVSANAHTQLDGPVEHARKAQKMKNLGKTDEEVCIAFGWSKARLQSYLVLLDVSAPIRKAVEAGQVSVSAAAKLAGMAPKEQE